MNKNYLNKIIIVCCLMFIFICFKNINILSCSFEETFTMFIKNIFPFLFTMMVINAFLIKINFPYYLSKYIKNPYIYIFLLSSLCGCPTNAVIIKEFLENKTLDINGASSAICFSTINNPLFLTHYFNMIFKNSFITIKLLLIIYLSNIIILIYFAKKKGKICYNLSYKKVNFLKIFIESLTYSINTMISILATICFTKLLCDLLFPSLNILSSLFKGLIEITGGLNEINKLNISFKIKELLVLIILSFSGLSIHIQISNILSDYNINYKFFYLSRSFLITISFIILIH